MSIIYKSKDNAIEYFICQFMDEEKESIEKVNLTFFSETEIRENAFAYSSFNSINIKSELTKVGESAFENCNKLCNFVCGSLEENQNQTNTNSNIKGISLKEIESDFIIQKDAFKNCSKLETVILPKIKKSESKRKVSKKLYETKKLIIEKDAFSGCESLRTVVALCEEIDFTENPFADCPDYLTFVCRKNSKIDRFARENDYRSVYVE